MLLACSWVAQPNSFCRALLQFVLSTKFKYLMINDKKISTYILNNGCSDILISMLSASTERSWASSAHSSTCHVVFEVLEDTFQVAVNKILLVRNFIWIENSFSSTPLGLPLSSFWLSDFGCFAWMHLVLNTVFESIHECALCIKNSFKSSTQFKIPAGRLFHGFYSFILEFTNDEFFDLAFQLMDAGSWTSVLNIWGIYLSMSSLDQNILSNMLFKHRFSQEWLPKTWVFEIEIYQSWRFKLLNVCPDIFLPNDAPDFFHGAYWIKNFRDQVRRLGSTHYLLSFFIFSTKVVAFTVHWIPNLSHFIRVLAASSNEPAEAIWDSFPVNDIRMKILASTLCSCGTCNRLLLPPILEINKIEVVAKQHCMLLTISLAKI